MTPEIHNLLHPRGDLIDGLLEEYQGPITVTDGNEPPKYQDGCTVVGWVNDGPAYATGACLGDRLWGGCVEQFRLPLFHREAGFIVRSWAVRVLAEGERCCGCGGDGYVGSPPDNYGGCEDCGGSFMDGKRGTGFTRPPHPSAWQLLDMPGRNSLAPWESAALLGCSLVRVSKGLGVVGHSSSASYVSENNERWLESGHYLIDAVGPRTLTLPTPDGPLVVREEDCNAN